VARKSSGKVRGGQVGAERGGELRRGSLGFLACFDLLARQVPLQIPRCYASTSMVCHRSNAHPMTNQTGCDLCEMRCPRPLACHVCRRLRRINNRRCPSSRTRHRRGKAPVEAPSPGAARAPSTQGRLDASRRSFWQRVGTAERAEAGTRRVRDKRRSLVSGLDCTPHDSTRDQ
jgi:hypothetical protein